MTHLFTADLQSGAQRKSFEVYFETEEYHFKELGGSEVFTLRRKEDEWKGTHPDSTLIAAATAALDKYLLAQHWIYSTFCAEKRANAVQISTKGVSGAFNLENSRLN